MKPSRRAIVRNLVFVALMFVLVAALIAAANLYQPQPILSPESPRLPEMKQNRAYNAWWTCREALDLLPARPIMVPRAIPVRTGDLQRPIRQWPHPHYLWEDPHIENVALAARSLRLCRRACQKPLYSPSLDPPDEFYRADIPRRLPAILLDAALLRSECGDHRGACRDLRDALRLERLVNSETYTAYMSRGEDAARIIRNAPPRLQRQMLDFLTAFRRSWVPPTGEIEQMLRMIDAHASNPLRLSELNDVVVRFRRIRRKRQALQDKDVMFQYAQLLAHERPDFLALHPDARDLRITYQMGLTMPVTNSQYVGAIDGLAIAAALELYRHDHGAYPDSLAALAPRYLAFLPVDPFTGAPFTYRRTDGDYSLCSLGEDKAESKDDIVLSARPE